MQINFSTASIHQLIIHRIGNKSKEEGFLFSESEEQVPEQYQDILNRYFLQSLPTEISYRFDLEEVDNVPVLFEAAGGLFGGEDFISCSRLIGQHLFNVSVHPKVKQGELYVVLFHNIAYENRFVRGLGIFKTEQKEPFMLLQELERQLTYRIQEGIGLRKPDKGCLILEAEAEDGYRIFTADFVSEDSRYWKEDFLRIEQIADHHLYTKQVLETVREYASEVIGKTAGRKEELAFMQESFQFMQAHEAFNAQDFSDSAPERKQFASYLKTKQEQDEGWAIPDRFEVSDVMLKKNKKDIPSSIQLDTGFQIKLPFGREDREAHIERGYDPERQMYYYILYYNRED